MLAINHRPGYATIANGENEIQAYIFTKSEGFLVKSQYSGRDYMVNSEREALTVINKEIQE